MKVTQGVPLRSVLIPLIFNLDMTVIPEAISNIPGLPVRIAIYADDVALRCVGKSTQAQAIRARLQESLSAVSCRLKKLGLSISRPKSSFLLRRRRGRLPSSCFPVYLDGERVRRVKRHRYLDVIIDDRVSWRTAVTDVLAAGRRVLSFLRIMGGQTWGGLLGTQFLLYHDLAVSRCLYGLPLLSISPAQ